MFNSEEKEMFIKKPGWYLRYRILRDTLNQTATEKLVAATEEEAIIEAKHIWDAKEKRPESGYNLRGERTEEVFPNTPQLVYYSGFKLDENKKEEIAGIDPQGFPQPERVYVPPEPGHTGLALAELKTNIQPCGQSNDR